MTTWEDIHSYCKELSDWIVETNKVEEIKAAFPRATFPIVADESEDDIPDGLDTLFFLTLWVAASTQSPAPDAIESRIMFLKNETQSPWQQLYIKLREKLKDNKMVLPPYMEDWIWNLAI